MRVVRRWCRSVGRHRGMEVGQTPARRVAAAATRHRACTRSSRASHRRTRRSTRRAVSPAAAASPAMYSSGMKWSAVGTAWRKSMCSRSSPISSGASVMKAIAASLNRCAQSKPASGWLQSTRRRLCTTLPLATISTPRSRSGASAAPERDVVGERLVGVDRQLQDGDVGVRKRVHQHRPGAVVDAPAVEVHADPRRLHDLGDLLGQCRVARRRIVDREQLGAGSRRSRGSSSAWPWQSRRWR